MSDPMTPAAPLQAAPDLFELQLSFNLFPATYAHWSWIEQLGFCELSADPAGLPTASTYWIRSVSDALLTEFALEQQFDFDFSSARKRVALLDADAAIILAKHVAAILLRERFRTVIAREAVAELRAKVGADAHRFALQFDGDVPRLTGLAEQLTWCATEHWDRYMAALVAACLPEGAFGVHGRLQLRFPNTWATAEPVLAVRACDGATLGNLFTTVARHLPIAPSRLFDVDASMPMPAPPHLETSP
jgi:hypothetical protein